ncbi:MAG TPA: glycosyl transferase family 2 [Nitrospiria bacterium]|nr:glycosyl transferase family 2 [Nitrospiria bacterium]
MTAAMVREDLKPRLDAVGQADILVGVPSYNNARTIGRVVQAVGAGLAKYFPEARAVLVNSDGGSNDGTPETVEKSTVDLQSILVAHRVNPLHKIVTPYHGIPGKGSAFRLIFEIAEALKVRACAVVDADLRSITPDWMELLLRPVYKEGYDYVAPYYRRHKYDGTITNGIVYPLTRALYGMRIRQPIGGEFGFTGELAAYFLAQDVWETDVARYGIDIWMTTTAIARGSRICQAYLGAKIHDPKDPAADLSAMLTQVVGSTFSLMEKYAEQWKAVRFAQSVPIFGFEYDVGLEPVPVNVDRMVKAFELGREELMALWTEVLSSDTLAGLKDVKPGESGPGFSDGLWTQIVYEFALAFHRRVMTREHLLKSFTPLYLGRVASFILETRSLSYLEVEGRIERLCQCFEREKNYLTDRWDQPSVRGGAS